MEEIAYRIKVPEGIETSIQGHKVTVKTPNGEQTRDFKNYRLTLEQKDKMILISGKPVDKRTRKLVMSAIAHLKNMMKGLKYGYQYTMELKYSHFPMTAEVGEKEVLINNFIGEKFPRKAKIVGNTKVESKGKEIHLKGYNLEDISQTTTNIEQITKVRGRDIRRFTDGAYLSKKETIEELPEDFEIEILRGRE